MGRCHAGGMSETAASPPSPPPSLANVVFAGALELVRQIGRKLRWVALGGLLLVMQWPLSRIDGLVWERQQRRDEATAEVTRNFGQPQTLVGPILTVPYRIWKTDEWIEKGKTRKVSTWRRGHAHFLPAELKLSAVVNPQIRRRGLFEVPVYDGDVAIEGKFDPPDLAALSVAAADVLWGEAWLSVEVSDRRALTAPIQLTISGERLGFEVGSSSDGPLERSLHSKVPGAAVQAGGVFAGIVKLRGSQSLSVAAMGGRTRLAMTSR
jgi:inner membrane protein